MDQSPNFPAQDFEEPSGSDGTPMVGLVLPPIEDVLEHTTDCVVLLDAEWRFAYLNGHARAILCRGRELIGAPLHEVFASEKGTREWKLTQAAGREKKSTRFEFFASHLKIWFEVHIHPIPSGLQIYFRDVTSRRLADAALAEREETLRLALEAVGDAAWDWNLKSGKIVVSGPFVTVLGNGSTRFDGSIGALSGVIHPGDVGRTKRVLTNHLAGRSSTYRCEYRIRTHENDWRWNLDRGRVIERDPISGWATRIVGTSTDITNIIESAAGPRRRS